MAKGKVSVPGKQKWRIPKYIERKYETLINKLLKPLRDQLVNVNTADEFERLARNYMSTYTFNQKAEMIAKMISTYIWRSDGRTWREAAHESSRSSEIKQALLEELKVEYQQRFDELMERNARIIKTLPLDISRDVIKHVNTKTFQGIRSDETAIEIRKFTKNHMRAKAKLIARTETSKTQSALTQVRSESLGIYWYVWRTSEDSIVRESHKKMDRVVCNYKFPPSPEELNDQPSEGNYGPGEIYNCRCYAEPLLDDTFVRWPCKVYNYKTKKIETMTLAKFREFKESL